MKRTPLYNAHIAFGAKMVSFGGWDMPVQYTSIIDEHMAVRTTVGLFDISHMGEIEVTGAQALSFCQYVATNDVSKLKDFQAHYSALCYPSGGVVDDIVVYRFSDNHFLLCVNAGNTDKDFEWLKENCTPYDVEIINRSQEYAQLSIQGPNAQEVLQKLVKLALNDIKYYWLRLGKINNKNVILSRTGYTGEDGFEIYTDPDFGVKLWDMLLEEGSDRGIKPIGLGARDTLRLEMGYPLYGHELDENTSPLEAGLGWIVNLNKGSFLGSPALSAQKKEGLRKKLVGFEMLDSGIPRAGYKIFSGNKSSGYVTSGTMAPSLKKAIGIGYVPVENSVVGQQIQIEIRNRLALAKVVPLPFWKSRVKK